MRIELLNELKEQLKKQNLSPITDLSINILFNEIEKLQVENEFLKTTIKVNHETETEETKREFTEYSLGKL